ncbi:TIM-barrel domain-containing protein [uncultured Psychroserpens sp.]|uniref:TIM-barrel domain-containing protein n=1 Tax=uncultured Psychroserpens sp. TaxID=255436 RepID=UPI002608FA81|nr:TIM-barrel domain-containing protein [uncultured Psychroserpens sp.]
MKNLTYVLFIILSIQWSVAQNDSRKYQSHNEGNGIFSVITNDGTYTFQFYSEAIIETTFIPNDDKVNPKSHAVVMSPEKVKTTYAYVGNTITYGTSGISVSITTNPFQISYTYKDQPVISEKRGYYKSNHEPMDLVKGNIVADQTEKIEFNITKQEILYGGGARALGMNRRGNRLPLFNRAHYGYETRSELMNYTLPIVMSSNQYMIHFDNAPIGYLDLDSKHDNTLTYETISGRKTYQLIAGDSWYDIMDNYTNLTGKQPMLPRWALGNFSSRFGYHSQKEVLETISKFREEEIPVDAIILDLYWFGKDIKGTMGNLEFLRDSFPDPKQMVEDLKSKNVETILITEPFILSTSNRWKEAVDKDVLAKDSIGNPATYDFYFGNTGIIDIYSNNGNAWFKTIYKDLAKLGVNGFWGDLGEPEVHPNWVQHATGSADEVHNIYGHDWAKLVYEASLEVNPQQRPFILMRAGYSGSQRYGMVPWSGDVNRSWGGLQSQPEIALQMSMQGLAYMHSDLGGFAGANLDDELYVRWLQYGVFQPIYRPHAQEDVASEPIFRSEKAKALAKEAIGLRYKMLPYNYNLVYRNNLTGAPLMRPLFFEEAENLKLATYSEAYLWGKDFLVSPILKADQKEKEIYFPKNNVWFDFYTDEKIEGGQTKMVETRENSIPTYLRAGAFIPLERKEQQSTTQYTQRDIELHYYHDARVTSSYRSIYDDKAYDNKYTLEYDFMFNHFKSKYKSNKLFIEIDSELGKESEFSSKVSLVVIHGISKAPKQVKINGKATKFQYEEGVLRFPIDYGHQEKQKKIKIKLKK